MFTKSMRLLIYETIPIYMYNFINWTKKQNILFDCTRRTDYDTSTYTY